MNQFAFYKLISRIPFLKKSFKAKVMVIAFLGTHIPLLTILYYFLTTSSLSESRSIIIFLIALAATLIGTLITLLSLNSLLRPLELTGNSLHRYLDDRTLPEFENIGEDEIGTLMEDTNQTILKLNSFLVFAEEFDEETGVRNFSGFRKEIDTLFKEETKSKYCMFQIKIHNLASLRLMATGDSGGFILKNFVQKLQFLLPFSSLGRKENSVFLSIFPYSEGKEFISKTVELVENEFKMKEELKGNVLNYEISIGVFLIPEDAKSGSELLEKAEASLYDIDAKKKRGIHFFSSDIFSGAMSGIEIQRDLEKAIKEKEFYMVYQPRVHSKTGEIISAEALIRWEHPKKGLISPGVFIPIAEESGKIIELGDWILEEVIAQLAKWKKEKFNPKISINVSTKQLESDKLPEKISGLLQKYRVEPEFIELEVTESAFMYDIEQAKKILMNIREKQIQIALDDFGTGYSSLSYLSTLPFNTLKIDASFVKEIKKKNEEAPLVKAIISIARSLNLKTTAEGVETEEQAELLKNLGCDEIQGYYYSKPLKIDKFIEYAHKKVTVLNY